MRRKLQLENTLSSNFELEDYMKDSKNRVVVLPFFFLRIIQHFSGRSGDKTLNHQE